MGRRWRSTGAGQRGAGGVGEVQGGPRQLRQPQLLRVEADGEGGGAGRQQVRL